MTPPNDQQCPKCTYYWNGSICTKCGYAGSGTDRKPVASNKAVRRYLWCRNGMAINREEIVVPAVELVGDFVAAEDFDALAAKCADLQTLLAAIKVAAATQVDGDDLVLHVRQLRMRASLAEVAREAAQDALRSARHRIAQGLLTAAIDGIDAALTPPAAEVPRG